MNVLLINPPTSFEQIYGDWDLSALDTYTPPLGLLHLAAYIREYGFTPSILDLQTKHWELPEIIGQIVLRDPDILGLTAMTVNCINADRIAQEIKKIKPSIPIILGGSHITAVPRETMENFTSIDMAVLGEGELTLLELVEWLGSERPIMSIPGIAWRNAEGKLVINEPRGPISNLDSLPLPAWDLLDGFPRSYPSSLIESKRLPAAGLMTSRGCPFQCTFCDHQVFGTNVRHFSADYTLNMIRHLAKNYGIRDIMFIDDNFLIDRNKLFKICDAMIQEKMNLTWYCMAHTKFMTEDRLKKIKEAGCWFVELGIESGNDSVLKSIKKIMTKAEIKDAVDTAKKVGLKLKGNFIFGFPQDTKNTLEETIQFALDLKIDFFQQNFLTIWPGCQISRDIKIALNGVNPMSVWSKLAHQRITYVPPGLSENQLIKSSKEAFGRFYIRPRMIMVMLPYLTTLRGIKFCAYAFLGFLKTAFRRKAKVSDV